MTTGLSVTGAAAPHRVLRVAVWCHDFDLAPGEFSFYAPGTVEDRISPRIVAAIDAQAAGQRSLPLNIRAAGEDPDPGVVSPWVATGVTLTLPIWDSAGLRFRVMGPGRFLPGIVGTQTSSFGAGPKTLESQMTSPDVAKVPAVAWVQPGDWADWDRVS